MTEPGSPRSIPEEYAAKMKAARATDSMRGERRLVSILFCDVTGSNASCITSTLKTGPR